MASESDPELEIEALKDKVERLRVTTEELIALFARHLAGEDVKEDFATLAAEVELTRDWFQDPRHMD